MVVWQEMIETRNYLENKAIMHSVQKFELQI
jgi:hypothetical protein